MPRRRQLIALAAVTAFLTSSCVTATGSGEMSTLTRTTLLPTIGESAGFAEVVDWRDLDRPTLGIREFFAAQGATYRLIDADHDAASLAVWQTGAPGPEPFNANRTSTGTGCVELVRVSGAVRTSLIDCPTPLLTQQPSSSDNSWGRDSEALRNAATVIEGSMDQQVRWLMTKEVDGTARRTPRTADQVTAAAHRTIVTDDQGVVLTDVREVDGTITALVTAHSSGVDPVDTHRTVVAQACATMRVVLADAHPNVLFTATTCAAS